MLIKTLYIDLVSYWHAGSGRSAGALADALVQKNSEGLPVIGGRHIKGLLRHAFSKAQAMGWYADMSLPEGPATDLETLLFGSVSQQDGRYETLPGMLLVSDAVLPSDEAEWLAVAENSNVRQYLYSHISSTAINSQGTAIENSLRTIEVVLPMKLVAQLHLGVSAVDKAHRIQQQSWLAQEKAWLPLIEASSMIDSIGASRSRGLGEAKFIWDTAKGAK